MIPTDLLTVTRPVNVFVAIPDTGQLVDEAHAEALDSIMEAGLYDTTELTSEHYTAGHYFFIFTVTLKNQEN